MGHARTSLETLSIERPTVVLDRDRVLRNIGRMVERAASLGVALRPHFKTHQSVEVGRWFRDFGVRAITVSSVEMARYFAGDGWSDITIAFPVNVRELTAIAELSERVSLGVLVDSADAVEAVARMGSAELRVWIKVDTGYGRAGIAWDDEALLAGVIDAARGTGGIELAGLLTYNGLSYRETGGGSPSSRGGDGEAGCRESTALLPRSRRARRLDRRHAERQRGGGASRRR